MLKPASRWLLLVRPAWAHSCGCKSRRELVTTSEVKRNCVRATERGEEAWSVNREPMNKNRIEGVAKQGEQAQDCEALVTKVRWRRCGGCAMKVCDSYLGRSRLVSERKTAVCRSEKSAEVVVAGAGADEATRQERRTERGESWMNGCATDCGPSNSSTGKGPERSTGNSKRWGRRKMWPSKWRSTAAAGGATATGS